MSVGHRCNNLMTWWFGLVDAMVLRKWWLSNKTGAVLIHPSNDPLVIAGQGTVALEFLEQCPFLDAIIIPVGGGGLISGSMWFPSCHWPYPSHVVFYLGKLVPPWFPWDEWLSELIIWCLLIMEIKLPSRPRQSIQRSKSLEQSPNKRQTLSAPNRQAPYRSFVICDVVFFIKFSSNFK